MKTDHEAYLGVRVDHLYQDCPLLRRSVAAHKDGCCWCRDSIGQKLVGTVDPEGTDICGWCYRKWLGRTDEV